MSYIVEKGGEMDDFQAMLRGESGARTFDPKNPQVGFCVLCFVFLISS